MAVDLYYTKFSPPCRAVLLTAEAIGISLNLIEVDLFNGEQLKPEYEQVSNNDTTELTFSVDTLCEHCRQLIYLPDEPAENSPVPGRWGLQVIRKVRNYD